MRLDLEVDRGNEVGRNLGANPARICPRSRIQVSKGSRISGTLVGAVGVEPTTNGLKGRCSTTELRSYIAETYYTKMIG